MHRLCTAADLRFLYFHKVSHHGALLHPAVHAQMRKGTDGTVISNLRIDDDAVVLNDDAVTQMRIRNSRTGANLASFSDAGIAFDTNTGINDGVASDLGIPADVSMRRIDKGNAA